MKWHVDRDVMGGGDAFYYTQDNSMNGFELNKGRKSKYVVSEFDDHVSGFNARKFKTKKLAENYIRKNKMKAKLELSLSTQY
jgi:hypothetical protein